MEKTNAMRMLEGAGIPFGIEKYEVDEQDLSGQHVADISNLPAEKIFKTLVLKGEKNGFLVCCIPTHEELDLKKVAKAAGEKKVEMILMRDLYSITGYLRGGCSPIGMKKKFPTLIDETATLFQEIFVSAGTRGLMLRINPANLVSYIDAREADLTKS